jgi:hypothetical protein
VTVNRHALNLIALGAIAAGAVACENRATPFEVYGRTYDFRVLLDARNLPGGTAAVTQSAGTVTGVTLNATNFPAGSYTAYLIDERTGTKGASVAVNPSATGAASVAVPALGTATAVVVTTGDAGAPGAMWARFRNLATDVVSASAAVVRGHFEAQPDPFPFAPRGAGRGGFLELGEHGSNDFELGVLIDNLAVLPPGFAYHAWLEDVRRPDVPFVHLGTLLNDEREPFTGFDVLPTGDQLRELPRLRLTASPSAAVDFTHYTHLRISMERVGAAPTQPSNNLLTGVFGGQWVNVRRPELD